MNLSAAILFLLEHGALLIFMMVVAVSAGTAAAGRQMSLAIRLALGLAVIGQALVILGTAGLLRPWAIGLVAGTALLIGAIRQQPQEAWRVWPNIPMFGGDTKLGHSEQGVWSKTINWKWVALITAVAIPLFVLALYPPLAFDETLYHLPFIRAAARSGEIGFLTDLRFPAFPQLHELLCVPAFLAMDDVATHLVALLEALALAAVLVAWPGQSERRAGLLAAALFLGNPIVMQLATVDHPEMALTLFVAAGFFCLDRIGSDERRTWPLLAGFFLGSACSAKYLGGYFPVCALGWLIVSNRRRRAIPLFLAGLIAGVLPMFGRILALSGSPIFPFLPGVFGKTPWTMLLPPAIPAATRIVNALRLPWDVTFARERLNHQPPYSPLVALAAVVTFVAAFRSRLTVSENGPDSKQRWALTVTLLCAGYVAIFTFLPQDSRYLLPLVPIVAIAAAVEVAPRLRSTTAIVVLTLVAIAPGPAYAIYRVVRQGPPPVTPTQRREFLERNIPEYRALERRGAGRIYACGAEQLKYFGGDDFFGEVGGPFAADRFFGPSRDAASLEQNLSRIGVRYLLISRRACPPEWQRLPAAPEFELVYPDESATLWRLR